MNALVGVLCRACGRVPLPHVTPEGVCSSAAACSGNRDGAHRPVVEAAVDPVETEDRRKDDADLRAESDDDYEHAMTCAFCIELYGQMPHGQRRQSCSRWQKRNEVEHVR
jgi:hypothetical protein